MATPSRCEPAEHIDEVDAQLLRLLQADGRISITRLAEAVGLAPATVHERVARLKREGVILGYEAVLNPAKLNSGLLVFAEIRVADATPGLNRALKAAVQARDEVIECHEVAGSFDYLIKTRVPDMHGYREFMNTVVWSLPGVREVRTYAVIDEVKSTSCIPV
jgi:Lrp/AsnC family leucine-responsive transcriptional regulator